MSESRKYAVEMPKRATLLCQVGDEDHVEVTACIASEVSTMRDKMQDEIDLLKGERDRQYEYNAGQIATIKQLQDEVDRLRVDGAKGKDADQRQN